MHFEGIAFNSCRFNKIDLVHPSGQQQMLIKCAFISVGCIRSNLDRIYCKTNTLLSSDYAALTSLDKHLFLNFISWPRHAHMLLWGECGGVWNKLLPLLILSCNCVCYNDLILNRSHVTYKQIHKRDQF